MRRLTVMVALAAALAGCSVNVEGARCSGPGAAGECPDDQACGTNGRCSVAARSCTPCVAGTVNCRDLDVKRCTTAGDPACGTWEVVDRGDCEPGRSICPAGDTLPAGAECVCQRFVVETSEPAATAACRFTSIKAALAAAAASAGVIDTVLLGGATSAVFGGAPGDEAPITVPTGIALIGDEATPAEPTSKIIDVAGSGLTGLVVEPDAAVRGLTIRKAEGAAAAVGVEVQGASPAGEPSLMDVWVAKAAGLGAFETGVLVSGAGEVSLQRVTVLDSSGSGLLVNRASAVAHATVTDLLAKRNGIGVNVTLGDLTLQGATVQSSAAQGVLVFNDGLAQVGIELQDSLVQDNSDTGLSASNVSRFKLIGTRVCSNSAPSRAVPDSTTPRSLGGVVLSGTVPPVLEFRGNTIYANALDQLAVFGAKDEVWALDGAAAGGPCGVDRNAFTGYDSRPTGSPAVPTGTALVVRGATVNARWDAWQVTPPASNRDYLKLGADAVVNAGTAPLEFAYCEVNTSELTCEAVPSVP